MPLDGYGLCRPLPARPGTPASDPVLVHRAAGSLSLPSDDASRHRPCESLPLHLHQVGRRTCTSRQSDMLGTQRRAVAQGDRANPFSDCSGDYFGASFGISIGISFIISFGIAFGISFFVISETTMAFRPPRSTNWPFTVTRSAILSAMPS